MGNAINLTLPPGRLVRGSLYKGTTTDAEGKPLVVKNGPNAGQPRTDWYCEIAIRKGAEQHWAHTEWGKQLWQVGATAFPQHSQRPDFAWKIIDGDSSIPNKAGKVPNQQQGYAGHWIVRLSSGFKSPVFVQQGGQWVQQPQEDFVNPGDYVQAAVTVNDNGSQQQAGIYINHRMFAFSGHGERIIVGPDANSAGFATGLAPGASAAPLAGAPLPVAPPLPGMPATPPIPGLPPVPGVPAAPAVPAAPPVPPMPAAAPADPLVGTPGASHTVAALRAAGWSDDQIVSGGYATRAAPTVPAPLPPAISVPAPGAPAAPIAPAMAVIPNPAFPQIPPAPAVPVAPPAPAAPQLTPAGVQAGGSYEAFRAQGWSDDQLRASGYLA